MSDGFSFDRKLRILGLPADIPREADGKGGFRFCPDRIGACGSYRIKWPLDALKKAGLAETEWGAFTDWGLRQAVNQYDVIVMQRQTQPWLRKFIEEIHGAGAKAVFDFDDDVLTIDDPENHFAQAFFGTVPAFVWEGFKYLEKKGAVAPDVPRDKDFIVRAAKDRRCWFVEMLKAADAVTVTVPHLAERYAEHVGRDRIHVLPNCVEPREWNVEPKRVEGAGDRFVIGWAGGDTHASDIKLVAPPLASFLRRRDDCVLAICGFPAAREFFHPCVRDRILTVPWLAPAEYRRYVAGFDLVLAPAADTIFNRGKSPIRVYEAGMTGRPVVVSRTTYGGDVHEGMGLVCRSNSDWFSALMRMTIDAEFREASAKRLHEHVLAEHTYDANVGRWAELYRSLAARDA